MAETIALGLKLTGRRARLETCAMEIGSKGF